MVTKSSMILIFIFFYNNLNFFGLDIEKIDDLHHKGLYEKSYIELKKIFDPENPEPAIIWRIGRAIFVLSDQIPWYKRNLKIKKFNEGALFLEKYLNIKAESNREIASIYHWYVSNLALKCFTIGILESLNNLDQIIKLNDLAIKIDSTYSDPLYFKASLNNTLPNFLGGDQTEMGYYFRLAIKYAPLDINILIDAAKAFYKRNWDIERIQTEYREQKLNNLITINLNDRDYASSLINNAISIYESNRNPSYHDKIKIEEAYRLREKWIK